MRKLRITLAMLKDLDACNDAQDRFAEQYPRGLVVTDDQEENFEILLGRVQADLPTMRWGETADDCTEAASIVTAHAYDVEWLYHGMTGDWRSIGDLFQAAGELADAVGVYLERKG